MVPGPEPEPELGVVVELQLSLYPRSRSAAFLCISSECPRCGTSRIVLKRPFRQHAGELGSELCQQKVLKSGMRMIYKTYSFFHLYHMKNSISMVTGDAQEKEQE